MYDEKTSALVAGFYFAGAGLGDWRLALEPLRLLMGLHRVALICIGPQPCTQRLVAQAAEEGADAAPFLFCPDDTLAAPYAPLKELLPGRWLGCSGDRCSRRIGCEPYCSDPRKVASEACLKYVKLLDSEEGSALLAMWPTAPANAAFDEPSMARDHFLLTHLAQAVGLYLRSREARDLGASALDVLNRLSQPTLLVDQEGRIHYANDAARSYLADSPHLAARQGVLCCTDPGGDARLGVSLRATHPGGACEPKVAQVPEHQCLIPLTAADRRSALSVCVIPLAPPQDGASRLSLALLITHDPTVRPPVDEAMVAQTLGLTPAEARAAVGLAQGRSLAELAKASGLSVHTLRSQVQSAMAKTDTHRQTDLVALILRSSQTEKGLQLHCS